MIRREIDLLLAAEWDVGFSVTLSLLRQDTCGNDRHAVRPEQEVELHAAL